MQVSGDFEHEKKLREETEARVSEMKQELNKIRQEDVALKTEITEMERRLAKANLENDKAVRKYKNENERHRHAAERLALLENQLKSTQDSLKEANESKRQLNSDKVLSLERQVCLIHVCRYGVQYMVLQLLISLPTGFQLADVNERLRSETESYNKYKKMYSDIQQVGASASPSSGEHFIHV